MSDFLLEVGCEEIPARAMGPALEQLRNRFSTLLSEAGLGADAIHTFGSARRLVVHVTNLPESQPTETVRTLGPPESIAYKDGKPSKALEGFAKKSGLNVGDLTVFDTDKGKYVGYDQEQGGQPTGDLLASKVPELVSSLQFPKTMYWDDPSREFARPVRWVVALLGGAVVDFELFGVRSGSDSAGHRILGSQSIPVTDFAHYSQQLESNGVIVSQDARRAKIESELATAADTLGCRIIPDEKLLEEVVYINEYPTVVAGSFDRRFLDLPREVSVTVMREHQKYFAVEDSEGQLSGHFLGVMNTRSDAEGHIRKGHERVLKARLSDALFFWDVDGKRTLAERVEDLASVTFHKKLGSYKDKIDRMQVLARTVNDQTGAGVPADVLEQVIGWSKSDLVTDLVGEFADLQGVIGGLYARREGASDEVWKAIYDQYRPAGLDDRSPETLSGVVLALTDRIDTLFGCFSVGLIPKGSADPLALRRQTQGVIKTLLDHHLPFSIEAVITADGRMNAETASAFRSFYTDRLKYILGRMGFAYDEINAVVATGVDNPSDVRARVEALHTVRQSPDLEPIAAAFKRIKNILRQAEIPGSLPAPTGSMEPEEEALASAVGSLGPRIDTYMSSGDYDRALGEMATLRPVVDGFFLKILVMHEDDAIRSRRLNLLKSLSESFLKVADVSEIVTSTDTATAAGDS